MGEIIVDILLFPIGWLILMIRYRNMKKVRAVLKKEYDGSYVHAAKDIIGNAFLILFALMIFLLLLMGIVSIFI